jgi:hypothetical protein
MVTKQSRSLGNLFQWQSPFARWLRSEVLRSRLGQNQGMRLLEELLCYAIPDLEASREGSGGLGG